jgi:hypothetical protein
MMPNAGVDDCYDNAVAQVQAVDDALEVRT